MRTQPTDRSQADAKNNSNDPLDYVWSKGYLSTANPKNGEEDLKLHERDIFR